MTEARLFIVLLNYNSYYNTFECIKSLFNSSYKNYKIVVVDNCSKDTSEVQLSVEFDNIEFIRNDSNLGFAGGCNIGIRYALNNEAEYILLLNNDTVVHPEMLRILMSSIDKDTGLASGRILFLDEPDKIWFDGGRLDYSNLEARFYNYSLPLGGINNTIVKETDFITGCFMLISQSAVKRIGLFDEVLFAQYEDLDYCIRAKNKSVKISYIPKAVIWHKVSSSFGSGGSIIKYKPFTYYLKVRNKLILIKKYNCGIQLYLSILRTIPKLCKYFFGFLVLMKFEELRNCMDGFYDGICYKSTESCTNDITLF